MKKRKKCGFIRHPLNRINNFLWISSIFWDMFILAGCTTLFVFGFNEISVLVIMLGIILRFFVKLMLLFIDAIQYYLEVEGVKVYLTKVFVCGEIDNEENSL